jgi:hypothetical protein
MSGKLTADQDCNRGNNIADEYSPESDYKDLKKVWVG